jgi:glycerophosphoryl diester phosphodiesterase
MLFNLYRHYGNPGGLNVMQPGNEKTITDKPGFRLTRKRVLIGALTGVALSTAVGLGAMYGVQSEDRAQIIAHRGASAAAPENTMAAVKQAIADKADWVEIDVQETADDVVVVFHDSDFMKIANLNLKIWDATIAELAKIDIGSSFDARFKNERVPMLRQVLAESKGKIGVIIELKYYGHDQQLEQRVADIVESEGMQSDIMLMSLKRDKVRKMKALRPMWEVGLLTSAAVGDLTNAKADFLAVNTGLASRKFIRSAHESGKEVLVWTVNDVPTMSTMIGRGVDGLITDEPAVARTVLQHRANMSPLGRLLLGLAGILGVAPEVGEQ